ncbi:MAG TPA: serine/threonine-protein kinase [Gemmataceae bacterium]
MNAPEHSAKRDDPPLSPELPASEADAVATVNEKGGAVPPAAPRGGPQPWRLPPRYQARGVIARGGMGLVLRVHDTEVDRPLALKLLLDFDAAATALARRFLEEARITGQLQHPGIPPVHEVGRLSDGRPFFSMKLIAGRTLAELLQERPSPQSELPRFLHIFEQIAQTLAYAHAQGVLHRDLKPLNVMVGAFGEVQVMDWGLAKRLHDGRPKTDPAATGAAVLPPSDAATVDYRSADSVGRTQEGEVMGTFAYMPPEQARGEVDRLDARSDVFGLGAILCQILTGGPPYRSTNRDDLWRQARAGDLSDAVARLEACGAEAELIALAKRYLAAEPEERAGDAGVVAEQITAHLQSVQQRLQQAERERAVAAARAAEERKRRRWQLALTASLLLLVVLGAGGGLWLQHQQGRIQRQEEAQGVERQHQQQAIDAGLEEMPGSMNKFRWDEARALLTQVKSRLGEDTPEDLKQRLRQAEQELDLAVELHRIRSEAATLLGDRFDDAGADERYAAIFEKAGLLREGEEAETVAVRLRASAIHSYLVAALDDWAIHSRRRQPTGARWQWLVEIARRTDPGPWRDRFRDPSIWKDSQALRKLAGQAPLDTLRPQTLVALGQMLPKADEEKLLKAAQPLHRDDFWLNYELGNALLLRDKPREAEGYYLAALASYPRSYAVLVNLGNALVHQARRDEAISVFRRAIEINGRFAGAYANLGDSLRVRRQWDEAIAVLRKALEINPQSNPAYNNLGLVFLDQNKLEEAVAAFREAIRVNPNTTTSYYNLSRALHRQNKRDEAIAALREAIRIDPRDTHNIHYRILGFLLFENSKADEAVAVLRQYVATSPTEAASLDRRFSAACAVVRAAHGKDAKAAKLDESGRSRLRQQARDWLEDNLRLYRRQLKENSRPAKAMIDVYLSQWQRDTDLAAVREPAELAKLPEPERQSWQRLWSEVKELAGRVQPPRPSKQP